MKYQPFYYFQLQPRMYNCKTIYSCCSTWRLFSGYSTCCRRPSGPRASPYHLGLPTPSEDYHLEQSWFLEPHPCDPKVLWAGYLCELISIFTFNFTIPTKTKYFFFKKSTVYYKLLTGIFFFTLMDQIWNGCLI